VLHLKSFPATATIDDAQKGVVHAVISVYGNTDHDGEIMMPGAFKKSIDAMKSGGFRPLGLAYHDTKRPVAKTLDAWETGNEMHVLGQFNLDTQDGREMFSNIQGDFIRAYSHGFIRPRIERADRQKRIHDLEWREWSPVTFPANELTHTVGAKALLRDGQGFGDQSERVLAAVEDLLARAEEINALREKEGRVISQESRALLSHLKSRLDDFLTATVEKPAFDLQAETVRFIHSQNTLRSLLTLA
jgi:uncharacterized protein